MGLFDLKPSKNRTVGVIGFFLMILSLFGVLIYDNVKVYFEPIVLAKKYCYFQVGNDTTLVPLNVMASEDDKEIEEIYQFYLKLNDISNSRDSSITFIVGGIPKLPICEKVDVIKYSKDKKKAKVKYYTKTLSRPGYIEIIGYVPVFTLHDSLPRKCGGY